VHNLSYGNEFFLHVHFLANQSHFRLKGCSPELALKQKEKSNAEMAYYVGLLLQHNLLSLQWLTVQDLWQHLEEVFSHGGTAKVMKL